MYTKINFGMPYRILSILINLHYTHIQIKEYFLDSILLVKYFTNKEFAILLLIIY